MEPFYHAYEKYNEFRADPDAVKKMATVFLLFFFIVLILWLWALYALIRYWTDIPFWVKIIAILGLCTYYVGGPIISLIVIYASLR